MKMQTSEADEGVLHALQVVEKIRSAAQTNARGKEPKRYRVEPAKFEAGDPSIRDMTREALECYVVDGVYPGGYIASVLKNNLFEAVSKADLVNRGSMRSLVCTVLNSLPIECWGTPAAVTDWLEAHREFAMGHRCPEEAAEGKQ